MKILDEMKDDQKFKNDLNYQEENINELFIKHEKPIPFFLELVETNEIEKIFSILNKQYNFPLYRKILYFIKLPYEYFIKIFIFNYYI